MSGPDGPSRRPDRAMPNPQGADPESTKQDGSAGEGKEGGKVDGKEKIIEVGFESDAARLKLIRHVVRGAAQHCGCSEACADDIVIAVNEACMNVIQHAYSRDRTGRIILEIWRNDAEIIFRLVDFADPIDVSRVRPRDLDDLRPGGLGTHFIDQIMDKTAFVPPPDGAGNMLQMSKRIS